LGFPKSEKETFQHWAKMLGCFNPNLGQIWTNPNVGLQNAIKKKLQLEVKVEVGLKLK